MTQQHEPGAGVEVLADRLAESDAVLVGMGTGMLPAVGLDVFRSASPAFGEQFGAYRERAGFRSAADAFKPDAAQSEERWAFLAQLDLFLTELPAAQAYADLAAVLEGKDFHIVTMNYDGQIAKVFDEAHTSTIQGDARFLQCFGRCRDELYDAAPVYEKLRGCIEGTRIASECVPTCPECGAELEPWVYGYHFLEGERYKAEYGKWEQFMLDHKEGSMLFLELGIGRTRKEIVKQPFRMFATGWGDKGFYASVSPAGALVPLELASRGVEISRDIDATLADLRARL